VMHTKEMATAGLEHASSAPASEETERAARHRRALDVFIWTWQAVAVCAFIAVAIAVPHIMADDLDDGLGLLAAYGLAAASVMGGFWAIVYISTGEKMGARDTLKPVIGNMPFYIWFVLGVLYFGGLGYAFWGDSIDPGKHTGMFERDFAKGVGSALVPLALGAFGGLIFWKRKYFGHMVGTVLAVPLVIYGQMQANDLLSSQPYPSDYYSDDASAALTADMMYRFEEASQLLLVPEFREAVVAAIRCEQRTDLSEFVTDLWGSSQTTLREKYGNVVAENRYLIHESVDAFEAQGGC
ncbi:MAG: hypothetical protein AAFO72_06665, partial [Pseudomonadota bacterium]